MFDIKIEFTDGTEKIVENVEEYKILSDVRCFAIVKSGYRHFIPCENVKYIGKA